MPKRPMEMKIRISIVLSMLALFSIIYACVMNVKELFILLELESHNNIINKK